MTTASSTREGAAASAVAPSSPNGVSLPELAAQIRSEMTAVERGHRDELAHAIRAGALLTQAKDRVKHGEWLPWLEKNFPGDRTTATRYMQLAANDAHVHHLGSVREALAAIRKPRAKVAPKPKPKGKQKKAKPTVPEAVAHLRERVRVRDSGDNLPRWTEKDVENVEVVLEGAKKQRRGGVASDKRSGTKLRENSALRKKLGRKSVADLQQRILQMTSTLESSDIGDYDLGGEDAYFVTELYDDLVELQFWMDHTLAVTRAFMDDRHELEVIRKLREDTKGRSSFEITTAHAIADRLEAKRNHKLGTG